jgi:hypothetical protein
VTSWISWANASLDPICFLETPDGKVWVSECLVLLDLNISMSKNFSKCFLLSHSRGGIYQLWYRTALTQQTNWKTKSNAL